MLSLACGRLAPGSSSTTCNLQYDLSSCCLTDLDAELFKASCQLFTQAMLHDCAASGMYALLCLVGVHAVLCGSTLLTWHIKVYRVGLVLESALVNEANNPLDDPPCQP